MGTWLGETPAFAGRSVRRRARALCLIAAVLAAACAGDDAAGTDAVSSTSAGSTETAADTGSEASLRPCAEDRHLVAVDIVGFLTRDDVGTILGPWLSEGVPPVPRPGAAELFQTYRELGYELMYVSLLSPQVVPNVEELFTSWLADAGLPVGPGAELWVWDGTETLDDRAWVVITDRLLALAAQGVSIDAAYTEGPEHSYAFAAGGVPAERNFSLTPVIISDDVPPTQVTRIPNDDLQAHAAEIEQLPPVCQVQG